MATEITLNNSDEGLLLIKPDGHLIDKITYEKAPRGQSYNRTESGWVWSTILTPASTNIVSSLTSGIETVNKVGEENAESFTPEKSPKSQNQKESATIGEQISDFSKPFYVFLAAFLIALSSVIIVVILKKRTEKEA